MASKENDYGVFISDIARGVTDSMLKEEFAKIAEVAEAIVVKNKHSGETKGYGFVKFYNMTDCCRALDWPNPPAFKDAISGKVQKVKITQANTNNTLYIGHLPKDLSEREIKMELEDISACTIKTFEFDGPSKQFGWAHFKDHDTTIKAIKLIQKSKYTASLTKKLNNDTKLPSTKVIFARGVKSQEEGDLLRKQLGVNLVEKIVVPLDMQKKVPLGHAFVYCNTIEDAKEIMELYSQSGIEFQGKTIALAWGQPKQKHRFADNYALSGYDYSFMLYPEYYTPFAYPPPPESVRRGSTTHRGSGGGYDYPKTVRAPIEAPYPYHMVPPTPAAVKGYDPVGYPPYYTAPPMERTSHKYPPNSRHSRYTPY